MNAGMNDLGSYQRRTLVKDHPVIQERRVIASGTDEEAYIPGTVFGLNTAGKLEPWKAEGLTSPCILAEDVTVPATGDQYAQVYVHGAFVRSQLVWSDGFSADNQKKAIAALRAAGLYATEE